MADSVAEQLTRILDDYGDEVKNVARKDAKKAGRETAKELKNVSPKDTGEYASGWAAKQVDEDTVTVYNRKMPGLAHLLEKGHLIRNKKGTYGRAPAHPHIADVEAEQVEQFVSNVERDLQR